MKKKIKENKHLSDIEVQKIIDKGCGVESIKPQPQENYYCDLTKDGKIDCSLPTQPQEDKTIIIDGKKTKIRQGLIGEFGGYGKLKLKTDQPQEGWEKWKPDGIVALKLLLESGKISPEETIEYIENLISETRKEERERIIKELERFLLGGYRREEIKDGEIKLTLGALDELIKNLKL